jgi:hypothetical protein
MTFRPIGEIAATVLRDVADGKNATLLRAYEAHSGGTATPDQLALLQSVRDRHGAGPLPPAGNVSSRLGRMVSAPAPARDTAKALRDLLNEHGLAAIRLAEVKDPDCRKMIEAEAVKQLGGRA